MDDKHPVYQIEWPKENLVEVPIRKTANFIGVPQERIDEAQQRLDAAKDGDVVQIDADLEPFINRTEK